VSSTAQPSATGAHAAAAHHSADQLEKLREPAPPEWGGAGEARGRGHPPLWPPPRCGLRRQEVATLSGISVDYVVRLEQGRGPHSSRSRPASVAHAPSGVRVAMWLRLTRAGISQSRELILVRGGVSFKEA
jgi:hypothetical protein